MQHNTSDQRGAEPRARATPTPAADATIEPKPESIRVVITDDHSLIRKTLADWLSKESDITVVGEATTGDEAITECSAKHPDVVLLDIDMPGRLSFDAARTIIARSPDTKVVFLSAFYHDNYIEDALRAQASGYLTKSQPPEQVVEAVRNVANGKIAFAPEVEARIVVDKNGLRLCEPKTRVSTISPRELEVLRYIARGLSKKEIAATMHISVKTVDNHTTSLMSKLDLHDRVELTRFAIREGISEA